MSSLDAVIPWILKDKLNDNQLQILKSFLDDLPRDRRETEIEEDCCGMSSITFTITASGIGDCIKASYGDKHIWLDDGLDP